jgi:tRNA modification GTPase
LNLDHLHSNDTIVALATPQGTASIAVIRLSGKDAIKFCEMVFCDKKLKPKKLSRQKSHTVHYGYINDGEIILDEVLVTLFKNPNSYTGENVIEISCHGSVFIQQQIVQLFIKKGVRMAKPGEFTLRAFSNGKMDLSQAEAVADLISSSSSTSHQVAMQHIRGGFSDKIKTLRDNLVNFASLIELELDFSEEDLEFANRNDLKKLVQAIQKITQRLISSFEVGNVIKNGIPVAIVGKPNAGKSTLLNTLLNDEKAIVSDLPGTTRDAIEDEFIIDGVLFRFIDTAGIRETTDVIESMGVARTFEKIKESSIVIYLFDVHEITSKALETIIEDIKKHLNDSQLIIVGNKIDKENLEYTKREFASYKDIIFISAKEKQNLGELKKKLIELFDNKTVNITETVVTNVRHVEALSNSNKSLIKILDGLNANISAELLAIDVRKALHHLGEITGEVTTDDLLKNIFSRFCIGK